VGETLELETVDQWRHWLEENHDQSHEVWLLSYRRHAGKRSLDFRQARDEALCFGWVDGVATNIDADSFAIHFTRRDKAGNWPSAQRKRLKRLVESGRVTDAGLAVAPADLASSGDH
jgi:uncharacterized protein YdeI (YjbR/CyaY-like superfamily)